MRLKRYSARPRGPIYTNHTPTSMHWVGCVTVQIRKWVRRGHHTPLRSAQKNIIFFILTCFDINKHKKKHKKGFAENPKTSRILLGLRSKFYVEESSRGAQGPAEASTL